VVIASDPPQAASVSVTPAASRVERARDMGRSSGRLPARAVSRRHGSGDWARQSERASVCRRMRPIGWTSLGRTTPLR
jgi:hypothetical protein